MARSVFTVGITTQPAGHSVARHTTHWRQSRSIEVEQAQTLDGAICAPAESVRLRGNIFQHTTPIALESCAGKPRTRDVSPFSMYPQSASAVARMLSTNPAPNAGHRGGAFQRQPSGRGDAMGDRKLVVITALLPPLFDVASK